MAQSDSEFESASLSGVLGRPAGRSLPALSALPPVYFFSTLACMLILHFFWPVVRWNLGASRFAGLPFALLGIAFVLTSVWQLHSVTTLMPFGQPTALVTRGFFRISRNPTYTGLLLSVVGAAIMLGSATPVLAIPLFIVLMHTRFIVHEERVLERRFGDPYRNYRRRVRRWL